MTLTKRQARALSKVIANYQELLEAGVEGELVCGKDPEHDPKAMQHLAHYRKEWQAAEKFQILLEQNK